MTTWDTPADVIAKGIVDELFDNDIDAVIVVSDIDVETASLSRTERRKLERQLDEACRTVCQEKRPDSLLESARQTAPGTSGFYVCDSRQMTIEVLTDVYERLATARKHDAYDGGRLLDNVGFIRLWIDKSGQ